jgi:hypothetical protein
MNQVIEYLPSKLKALDSNPSTVRKKEKGTPEYMALPEDNLEFFL